jgi:hypothetical protein
VELPALGNKGGSNRRNISRADKTPVADLKKDLQYHEAERQ